MKSILRGIGDMQASGMSYREIGAVLGIHWTRVGQVAKSRK